MLFWVYSERLLLETKLWEGVETEKRRGLKEESEDKEFSHAEDCKK